METPVLWTTKHSNKKSKNKEQGKRKNKFKFDLKIQKEERERQDRLLCILTSFQVLAAPENWLSQGTLYKREGYGTICESLFLGF